jgi:formate dehydrogenase maturation protein FdhE
VEWILGDSWTDRIARAKKLAAENAAGAELLAFYADLLTVQEQSYRSLSAKLVRAWSRSFERDLPVVREQLSRLLDLVAGRGPQPLALEARRLLEDEAHDVDDMLLAYWRDPSDRAFFSKAVLQPYASWLAEARIPTTDRPFTPADNRCPFCGGAPQLSILHDASDGDAGGRLLQCAICLTKWPFRRVVCAHCGEEDDKKLRYFHTPELDHLRADTCESCKHYLKAVDLTRLGLAVPLVDEVFGASLDLWARERGYQKIELNLVGL